jgi:3-oxoadipate enol-lactonase
MITRGTGQPLVLIPALQGRWEYMEPAVNALADASFRVLTFSLSGEPQSDAVFERERGLDNFVSQTLRALDAGQIERAVLCGVSFGGVVAVRFAARHPDRTSALVLASTPGPMFHLKRRHVLYSRAPWLFGPLFVAETPRRLRREIAAALPGLRERGRFIRSQLRTIVRAPISLARMGERARLISALDLVEDCARITAPTLVVTGEPGLDFVVPVETTSDYVRLIRGARGVVLERTGHQGTITRPEAFAAIVRQFVESHRDAAA